MDLHTDTNNFAPNEYREVVNLSGLVVYKGSNARVEIVVMIATKGNKAVNKVRCKQWWKYGPGSHDVH